MKTLFAQWYQAFPPVFFVLCIMWGVPNIWSLTAGIPIVVAGTFIVSRSSLEHNGVFQPAGWYLVSRSAEYFGIWILYLGYAIMSFAAFPYFQLLGATALYLFYRNKQSFREQQLMQKYEGSYQDYQKRVPAFFPSGIILKSGKYNSDTHIAALNIFLTVSIVLLWFFRRLSV